MRRVFVASLLIALGSGANLRAEPQTSVEQRYAADGTEVPSLQRHVLPLLGRLGCNGRACHGSFQGQGGFRLSLFGYDFKADHEALTAGDKPRVNLKAPQDSLALLKPTRSVAHKGGKLIAKDGWEYRILQRWIAAGAPAVRDEDAEFVTLEVEPKEIVFAQAGQSVRLRAVATWSDGTREDVTPLCRFRSNDEAIAGVDETGLVTAVGPGGSDVVAFYDNGVAPVQVILPVSDRVGSNFPEVPAPTKVDELVLARLRKLGIVPSPPVSDVEFLRRVSLDLTGTPPAPVEVSTFLVDTSADKRARKVEELLGRPEYAAWWATRLGDWTGNSEATGPLGGERGLNREKSKHWYQWLHRRVADNVPYDQLVEGIVLAVSRRPGQTFEEYCKEMSGYFRKDEPIDFAARPNMPHFWSRKGLQRGEGKALAFAHAFLGVSLQCAQCHKHPYDQWTKQDFDQFAAFFNGVNARGGNRAEDEAMKKAVGISGDPDSGAYSRTFVKLAESGKVLPFAELTVPAPVKRPPPRPGAKAPARRVITPKLLGGEEVVTADYGDPRRPVMDWMREPDNPYFARAFVNRVWASYFGVGLIEPTDDLNLANPPSNPALMDYLCQGFIKSGYDMKWLHRTIATSRTYQLDWRPNETNKLDERNFSRAVLRRLPAEVLYDALQLATASDAADKAFRANLGARAIGFSSGYSGKRPEAYAVSLFGKPPRLINCDCERSAEPSLLQTVYLRNDLEVQQLINRADGWLRQVGGGKGRDPDELIAQAYLRVLSRLPDERERGVARGYLETEAAGGLRDLLWALLNTKEFLVNR
jgi:hypothetical protein